MSTAAFCALILTVGVNYGYEPIEGSDGIRYVISIEPQMLDALRSGETLGSVILPEARGRIHAVQIVTNRTDLSTTVPPAASQPTLPITVPPQETPNLISAPALPPTQWPTSQPAAPLLPGQPNLLPDSNNVFSTSATELSKSPAGPSGDVDTTDPEEPETSAIDPWFLLAIASVIAIGSSGGMVFFGWLTFDYRSRYLGLLRESIDTDNSWLDETLGRTSRDTTSSEPFDSFATSEPSTEETHDSTSAHDSAWRDLAEEQQEETSDDWLKE